MATATEQKALGAFYTADAIARFLVNWAVRGSDDSVLDPSCGCGVFLAAAKERLGTMGNKRPKLWGVDIDPDAVQAVRALLPFAKLVQQDFFAVRPGDMPLFTAIVGNPPFIRYQTFNGSMRSGALRCAREAGVELPQLSSSWAPFLVHAVRFLRKGGRLGMVVPAELAHAQYAQEVLRFLIRRFGRITVRMFREKLFPELSEDTFLLLCEDFETPCSWFSVVPACSMEHINEAEDFGLPVNIDSIRSGRVRLTHYLVSAKARHLYESMSEQRDVKRLGEAADVGIGYVTGCNDYFHLTLGEVKKWRIPAIWLRPAVLTLGDFKGATFRLSDWKKLTAIGKKVYLLALPPVSEERLTGGVTQYLVHGSKQAVPSRFKCRVRNAWYSVPHVRVADAFVSYMSGHTPKLVANRANLVAPNTLHLVRFAKGWNPKLFVAGWYSSLTKLSCELEGHPLGGGMLKLEPSEAEKLLVALPCPRDASGLVRDLDTLLREGENEAATDLADSRVLRRRFGLSATECAILRGAATQSESWRLHKS